MELSLKLCNLEVKKIQNINMKPAVAFPVIKN